MRLRSPYPLSCDWTRDLGQIALIDGQFHDVQDATSSHEAIRMMAAGWVPFDREGWEASMRNETKRAAIEAALKEADEGHFISAEAVDAWLASWGSDDELPAPTADLGGRDAH